MSTHIFHEIYLHLNWHTKNDRPLITPQLEPLIYSYIEQRSLQTPGIYLHGLGGTETHLHVAFSMEPVVQLSTFIGQLKGGVSHDVNVDSRYKAIQWQRGFGIVSFSKNQLDWVLQYIKQQKEHHARDHHQLKLVAKGSLPVSPYASLLRSLSHALSGFYSSPPVRTT